MAQAPDCGSELYCPLRPKPVGSKYPAPTALSPFNTKLPTIQISDMLPKMPSNDTHRLICFKQLLASKTATMELTHNCR